MSRLIVAGATGLIGSTLLARPVTEFDEVLVLSRRDIPLSQDHYKLQLTDFRKLQLPEASSDGDAIICALGTTIKKAGSKQAFRAVDYDMVKQLARAARQARYRRFALVSSVGANEFTANFYLRTKGQVEAALRGVGFDQLTIVRPSLLLGEREEFRLGEKVGESVAGFLRPLFLGKLKKYRPVHAHEVSECLIRAVIDAQTGVRVIESNDI